MSAQRTRALRALLSFGLLCALSVGGGAVSTWAKGSKRKTKKRKTKKGKGKQKSKTKPTPKGLALFESKDHCGTCHGEAGWGKLKQPAKTAFDHDATGFPLVGAHAKVKSCSQCHRRGLTKLSRDCTSCHMDPHAGANSLRCEACHTARSWEVPRNFFNHDKTRFPLSGVHAALACETCHRNIRGESLATTPTDCDTCHIQDRSRGTPNHVASGFLRCGRCHTTSSWTGATYRHRTYALVGVHALQQCTDCHLGSASPFGLAGGGTDCLLCHQPQFNSTASTPGVPNHTVGAPFGSDCGRCHDNVNPQLSFKGATIR